MNKYWTVLDLFNTALVFSMIEHFPHIGSEYFLGSLLLAFYLFFLLFY